jgi:transposase-like protein
MKKVRINVKRTFTEEFKLARVKEYEKGTYSVKEISELYQIQNRVIYRWIYKFSTYNKQKTRIVEMSESSSYKLKELQQRIADLERLVGQKQLRVEFLEKMIELTEEHYGIDVKKNCDTPRSTTSRKTGQP